MNSNKANVNEPDNKNILTNKDNPKNEMVEDSATQNQESKFITGQFKMKNDSKTENMIEEKSGNHAPSFDEIVNILSSDPEVEIVFNDPKKEKSYKKIRIPLLRKVSSSLVIFGLLLFVFGLIVIYESNSPSGLKEAIAVQAEINLTIPEVREMKSITRNGVVAKNVVVCKYQYRFVVENIEYTGKTELTAMFGNPCLNEGELLPVSYEKGKPEINKFLEPKGRTAGIQFTLLGAFMFLSGFLIKKIKPHIEIS